MKEHGTALLDAESVESEAFTLEFGDVTGTQEYVANDIEPNMAAEDVAKGLAARMTLPDNVPWALRNDVTSAFLDDRRSIGEQVAPGTHVTVVPKAHLG